MKKTGISWLVFGLSAALVAACGSSTPTPKKSAAVPAPNLGLIPVAVGGAGNVGVTGLNLVPGLLTNNLTLAQNQLLLLAGSVSSVSMRFETWEPTDTQYIDYKESYNHPGQPKDTHGKIRENHQNEFNFFFKDDWKVSPSFTLNLGMRWDLFKVPDFRSGTGAYWTRGPADGNAGYFGISGRNFNEAFHNGGLTKAGLTEIVLIGKNSKYPDLGLWPSEWVSGEGLGGRSSDRHVSRVRRYAVPRPVQQRTTG